MVPIDYISLKSELQSLLKTATEIRISDIGVAQFVIKTKDNTSYRNISVDEIKSLEVNKSHKSILLLKDAINSDHDCIISVYGRAIRVFRVNSKTEEVCAPLKTRKRTFKDFSTVVNGLYDDDKLLLKYKDGMPEWINGGCNGPIRKRVLAYSAYNLYVKYPELFKDKLNYITKITRPVQYKEGYDVDTSVVDANTIYYFRKRSTIKNSINKLVLEHQTAKYTDKSAMFSKFVDYLFNEAFALFYCNISHGRFTLANFQQYGTEIIWYLACHIITGTEAMDEGDNGDWIADYSLEMLFNRIHKKVQSAKNNWNRALGNIRPTNITRCMYPSWFDKQDIAKWKGIKGIERKEHKKSREQSNKENSLAQEINKLKGEGYTLIKIAQQLNISKTTVQKYLSKGL
jgi:hypothetical protein